MLAFGGRRKDAKRPQIPFTVFTESETQEYLAADIQNNSSADSMSLQSPTALIKELLAAESELSSIVEEVLTVYDDTKASLDHVEESVFSNLYNKLMAWKSSLPEHLDSHFGNLPSILVLQ